MGVGRYLASKSFTKFWLTFAPRYGESYTRPHRDETGFEEQGVSNIRGGGGRMGVNKEDAPRSFSSAGNE